MKVSSRLYKTPEWKELRLAAIEHVNRKCEKCDRGESVGAILQLHHIKYFRGRRPWDYTLKELTVLCRRCHAEEHDKLMEHCNWEYVGEDVREERDGVCDFCGNDIRFEHNLTHERWGDLTVGTGCSDFLTETKQATEAKKLLNRRLTFCDSRRWQETAKGNWLYNGRGLEIQLRQQKETDFVVDVNGHKGKKSYKSVEEAKNRLFNLKNTGGLSKYMNNR